MEEFAFEWFDLLAAIGEAFGFAPDRGDHFERIAAWLVVPFVLIALLFIGYRFAFAGVRRLVSRLIGAIPRP